MNDDQRAPDEVVLTGVRRAAFLNEIERQCTFARIAADAVAHGDGSDETWMAIQAFLTAAANLSKIFWPIPAYKGRGEKLCEAFGLDDTSPLKNRDLRNVFDHFDEKIDDWARDCPGMSFMDSNTGNVVLENVVEDCILRQFVRRELLVIYRGKRYELPRILEAVEAVLAKVPPQAERW